MRNLFRFRATQIPDEPQIGMQWEIVCLRPSALLSETASFREVESTIQIIGVQDGTIEILDGSMIKTTSVDEWSDFFKNRMSHTELAHGLLGLEIHQLNYLGVADVDEERVENVRRRPAFMPLL